MMQLQYHFCMLNIDGVFPKKRRASELQDINMWHLLITINIQETTPNYKNAHGAELGATQIRMNFDLSTSLAPSIHFGWGQDPLQYKCRHVFLGCETRRSSKLRAPSPLSLVTSIDQWHMMENRYLWDDFIEQSRAASLIVREVSWNDRGI